MSGHMGPSISKIETGMTTTMDDNKVTELRGFASNFALPQCRKCYKIIKITNGGEDQVDQWQGESQVIPPKLQLPMLFCLDCDCYTCAGCGNEANFSADNIFTPLGVVNHCCEQGRLFAVWLLHARFDAEVIKGRKTTVAKRSDLKKPRKHKHAAPSLPGGIGYADEHHPHEADYDYFSHSKSYIVEIGSREEALFDTFMAQELVLLKACAPKADATADELAADTSFLRFSLLLDRIAEMMQNPIADITDRSNVYLRILDFLFRLASHDEHVKLLHEERLDKSSSPGLLLLCQPATDVRFSETRLPSVFASCEDAYKQARAYMQFTEKSILGPSHVQPAENKAASLVCNKLLELYNLLDSKKTISDRVDQSVSSQFSLWEAFMVENRVTYSDDVLKSHYHTKYFCDVKTAPRGRTPTIGKEIAMMSTSLPPGVFVKVADSRQDVMKFLMVGVEDTPYAGGLFPFDMYLPDDYPASPPRVNFVLEHDTSDGFTMNPNLHAGGGQVCLSLLNTWEGAQAEKWQPYKSTLLSVLVSIQAMILGAPVPYLNEPGYAHHGYSPPAIAHRNNVECKVVQSAMLFWLKPSTFAAESSSTRTWMLWKDVIDMYWKYNGKKVMQIVKEKSVTNSLLRTWTNGGFSSVFAGPHFVSRKGKKKQLDTPAATDLVQELAETLRPIIGDFDYQAGSKPLTGAETAGAKGKGKRKAIEVEAEMSSQGKKPKSEYTNVKAETESEGFGFGGSDNELDSDVLDSSSLDGYSEWADIDEYEEMLVAGMPYGMSPGGMAAMTMGGYPASFGSPIFSMPGISDLGTGSGNSGKLNASGKSSKSKAKAMGGKKGKENAKGGERSSTPGKGPLEGKRWRYWGDETQKAIREACKTFDVQPAKSNKESVERLENYWSLLSEDQIKSLGDKMQGVAKHY